MSSSFHRRSEPSRTAAGSGRPRSVGLFGSPSSGPLSALSHYAKSLGIGSGPSPSSSFTSYVGGSPKGTSYLGGSPSSSSLSLPYLSSSPSSSYLSSSPTSSYKTNSYSSGTPGAYSYSLTIPIAPSSSPAASYSTYGGTSSGYGGLTLRTPLSSSTLSLSSSPGSGGSSAYHTQRATPTRSSSFNRALRNARTAAAASAAALGSRSASLTSLPASSRAGSEGYESGGSQQSSRLGSPAADSPINSRHSSTLASHEANENGEIDYKKLYEALLLENERIKEKLQKTEEALNEAKLQIPANSVPPPKNSLSELEKRERRAMERKLSEMEEELKLLEQFKSENQKLKDENGALIRVISKLSK